MRLFKAALSTVALIAGAAISLAWADNYPSKPIRLIVPAGAGSPPDIRARWLAEKLRPVLGQPIIVDNRPGAAGMIGTEAAARSAADGYTLVLVHQGTLALNPHLYAHLPYDPVKDLAPVSRLVVSAMLLAVERPGQLNFGSGGSGSPPHMAGELFRHMANIDVWHIPYKTTPDALTDLIGGRITYTIDAIAIQLPQVRAGRIRAIAVTSSHRLAALPDIPTVSESGLPGYEYWSWMGVCAPAGTPKEIIARLNAEITKIARTPEARAWFEEQGGEPVTETPEQFAAYIKIELARWGKVIREAGIKAEGA